MIKKISDKDKQDWQNFISRSDKLENKDQKISSTPKRYIEKSIDLSIYFLCVEEILWSLFSNLSVLFKKSSQSRLSLSDIFLFN